MKKIFLYIVGLCIMLSLVVAIPTYVENAHGFALNQTGGHNDIYFTQVNITQTGKIVNVTLNPSTLATQCILYDRNGGTPLLLNTSTVSSGLCTFNESVNAGDEILVGQWKGSYPSSYTFYATTQPQPSIVNETLIFKNTGFRDSGTNWFFDQQSRFLIESVGMIYEATVPLTITDENVTNGRTLNASTGWQNGSTVVYFGNELTFDVTTSENANVSCQVDVNGTYSEILVNDTNLLLSETSTSHSIIYPYYISKGSHTLYCNYKTIAEEINKAYSFIRTDNWKPLQVLDFEPNNINFTGDTFISVANFTVEIATEEDFTFYSVFQVRKNIGITQTLTGRILINDVIVYNESLTTVTTASKITGFSLQKFQLPIGNNTIAIQLRKSSSANTVEVKNQEYHFIGTQDEDLNYFQSEIQHLNGSISSITYTPFITPLFQSNYSQYSIYGSTFSVQLNDSSDPLSEGSFYLQEGNNRTSISSRSVSGTQLGTASLQGILDSNNGNVSIYGKSNIGNTINWTDSIHRLELESIASEVNAKTYSNSSTNETNRITLGSGTHTLLGGVYESKNASTIYGLSALSVQSLTGSQTVNVRYTFNGSFLLERGFQVTGETGNIFNYFNTEANSNRNRNTTFLIEIIVASGESISLIDEGLTLFDGISLETVQNAEAPIPAEITAPSSGETVGGLYTIEWNTFSDINNNLANYTIYLSNSSDSIILGSVNVPTTSLNVDFSSYKNGSYTLTVEGEDTTNLKANSTQNFFIEDPIIDIVLQTPANNSVVSSTTIDFSFSRDQTSLCTLFLNNTNTSETLSETFTDVSVVNGSSNVYYVYCENSTIAYTGNSSVFLFSVDTSVASSSSISFLNFDLTQQSNVLLFIGLLFLYIMLIGFAFFFEVHIFMYFGIVLGLILGFIVFPISWILTACFWFFNALFLYQMRSQE